MKIILQSFLILLTTGKLYCQISTQEIKAIKSPEAAAFVNSNFLPLDEFTGKANVSIPLYSINLDGLEIPITLTYDTGGVKVNTASSNVGLNWSLNAGGVVNKEIYGSDDIGVDYINNPEYSSGIGSTNYGFLRHLFTFPPFVYAGTTYTPTYGSISEYTKDRQPDQYTVYAPGLNTTFVHNNAGQPIELGRRGNIIKTPFTDPFFLTEPFLRNKRTYNPFVIYTFLFKTDNFFKFGFKINATNGFEYSFYDSEISIFDNAENKTEPFIRGFKNGLITLPISGQEYDRLISREVKQQVAQANQTIHLSKIKNPQTNREVIFNYEDNYLADNHRRIELQFENSPPVYTKVRDVNYENDFVVEKLLKSILFPTGVINFIYDSSRLDIRGGKKLKTIEIRNKEGALIKGISFEQSYFVSDASCTDDVYCKRLKLDEINFFDKNSNKLPGYKFKYDTSNLPNRYSNDQDFLGFYNGLSGINQFSYKPKIYFKANQGKFSYIPFPFAGYALYGNGNGDKQPVLSFSKAGSLSRIVLPTGGYTDFTYELQSFDFQGSEISAGGLRIASQSTFDNKDVLQRKLSYKYKLDNGQTSGQIVNLPNFVDRENRYADIIYQNYNNRLEFNNSSGYVGYSQVKVFEENNGYTLSKYSNTSEYPNVYPANTLDPSLQSVYPADYEVYMNKYNNGLIPTLSKNYAVRRGNLLSSEVFSNSNVLLKRTINEYEYVKYSEIPVAEYQRLTPVFGRYSSIDVGAVGIYQSSIDICASELKKTVTNDYLATGNITNTTTFNYYADRPIVNETMMTNSSGSVKKQKNYYPFDVAVSSLPFISNLNSLNIIKPIKEVSIIDSEVLNTSMNSYQKLSNNAIVPSDFQQSKGNQPLEIFEQYNVYDKKSNLIEYKRKDGTTITTLYGYDYELKIAEIIGATYQEVLTALNISDLDALQTKSSTDLKSTFTNLRITLPNAQVSSYTHIPLVGVSTITDANGISRYFEYDTFNRLVQSKDTDSNKIAENRYNYSTVINSTTSPVFQEPLSVEIEKKQNFGYSPYLSSPTYKVLLDAKVKGGRGNYTYQWKVTGTTPVINSSASYTPTMACNSILNLTLTVIDDIGTSVSKNVTINSAKCNEPFYLGQIEGTSGGNNQYNFWINAEGGSYKFSYKWWFTRTTTSQGGTFTNTNYCPRFLINTTTTSYTGTLFVEVKDFESGYTILRSRTVTIYPEFVIPSCFIAGTKITMKDGSQKNIEKVVVGDLVQTFNVAKQKIEIGAVEKIVTPIHSELVTLNFGNNVKNTNTLDHPYYIKGKGWCSFDPALTKANYGLKVNKYEIGDQVIYLNPETNTIEEVFIKNIVTIISEQKTYNLQKVSKNHDFFANGILVHNKSIK